MAYIYNYYRKAAVEKKRRRKRQRPAACVNTGRETISRFFFLYVCVFRPRDKPFGTNVHARMYGDLEIFMNWLSISKISKLNVLWLQVFNLCSSILRLLSKGIYQNTDPSQRERRSASHTLRTPAKRNENT